MRYPDDFINQIICGDCLETMKGMPDNCIDTIITDPPYALGFMGKAWDRFPSDVGPKKPFANQSKEGKLGGMPYQKWVEGWAKECLRIAKPGATLLCFGGTRTYHRLACAIEDAGWIIKDCIMWIFGSGFPKASDISKQLQKQSGKKSKVIGRNPNSREKCDKSNTLYKSGTVGKTDYITELTDKNAHLWNGWKSHGLKPAYEPILVAMKPNEGSYANNALKWGVAGLNIDGGRIEAPEGLIKGGCTKFGGIFGSGGKVTDPEGHPKGRFPANVILDGESAKMLDEQSGERKSNSGTPFNRHKNTNGAVNINCGEAKQVSFYGDTGGASRFFYCAKASKAERNKGCEGLEGKSINIQQPHNSKNLEERYNMTSKNNHPTVKPLALMKYLCTLTKTPTSGIVLDPFCGSGTTLMACKELKRDYVGIDNNPEYCEIARKRVNAIPEPLF